MSLDGLGTQVHDVSEPKDLGVAPTPVKDHPKRSLEKVSKKKVVVSDPSPDVLEKSIFAIQQVPSMLKVSDSAVVGKTARFKLFLQGQRELVVGVDTFSDVNCISWSTAKEYQMVIRPYKGPTILSGTSHAFNIVGETTVNLEFQSKTWNVNFVVFSTDLPCPILGEPWLLENEIEVSYQKLGIFVGKDRDIFIPFLDPPISVRVKEETKIPANKAMFVTCVPSQELTGKAYMVEPSSYTSGALRTGRQIPQSDGPLQIFIANWDTVDITLAPGALVASMEELELPVDVAVESTVLSNTKSYKDHISSVVDVNNAVIGAENTPMERKQVVEFLRRWIRVFAPNPQKPGIYKGPEMRIITEGGPIKSMPRQVNPIKQEIQREHTKLMLENGIITPSNSPWASPVIMVPKKGGELRFCIDYRRVNAVTKKDAYPLPRVEDVLNALGTEKAKIFSKLDLASSFWQLPIHEDDREKTAFTTSSGTYQFTVMPFGLTGAPSAFCRAMNNTLQGLMWKCCLSFVDDIVVWAPDFHSHLRALGQVFEALDGNGFTLKFSKCEFFQREIEYLGYRIREGQIMTQPAKIQAIQNFPAPTNLKELQRFLGMAGWYRKMIKDYAQIAAPLFELLKTTTKVKWEISEPNSKQNVAFLQLKEALISEPIMRLPDWSKPFIVACDGSGTGTGGVLLQNYDGREFPVAYTSKSITKDSWRGSYYCETLSLVRALRAFRHYTEGKKFTVATDCGALSFWKKKRGTGEVPASVEKWLSEIETYDFELEHRPNDKMTVPDALSRQYQVEPKTVLQIWEKERPVNSCSVTKGVDKQESNRILLGLSGDHVREAQERDESCREVHSYLLDGVLPEDQRRRKHILNRARSLVLNNGVLYHVPNPDQKTGIKAYIPEGPLREVILHRLHDDPLAGHLGIAATKQRIMERFWWNNVEDSVKMYVNNCYSCKINKPQHPITKPPLEPLEIGYPWKRVQSDYIDCLEECENGDKNILVFIDAFTKYVELVATKDQTAETTAKYLVERVILRHGCPEEFLADNAGSFKGELKRSLEVLKIEKLKILEYAHNSNGLTERMNRTIEQMLRHYVSSNLKNWNELLPYIQFALNTAKSSVHKFTPFFLNTGRDANLPFLNELKMENAAVVVDDYNYHQLRNLHEGLRAAKETMQEYQNKMESRHNSKMLVFDVGDFVKVRKHGKLSKLNSPFHGPYRIIKKEGENNFIVDLNVNNLTEKYHAADLEIWQGDPPKQKDSIPQEQISALSPKQQKMLEYAREGKENWLPSDLVGRRIIVKWSTKNIHSEESGLIVGLAKNSKRFFVKYDYVKNNNDENVFEEDLLGIRPPDWRFEPMDGLSEVERPSKSRKVNAPRSATGANKSKK